MKLELLIPALATQYENAWQQIISAQAEQISVTSPYFIEDQNTELKVKMTYIRPAPMVIPEGMAFCGGVGPRWKAEVSLSPANAPVMAVVRKFFEEKKHPPMMMAPSMRIFADIKVNGEELILPGM